MENSTGASDEEYRLYTRSTVRRRFNPYLCAAWVLVAVLLMAGLAWLTGGLEPRRYATYLYEASSDQGSGRPRGPFVLNLSSLGPIPLLLGVMGAFTLLTVQAAGFRRARGHQTCAVPVLPEDVESRERLREGPD